MSHLSRCWAEADEPLRAIGHFVGAGEIDQLKKLAGRLPDASLALPLSDDLPARPSWERAAVFTIAGAGADLLSDAEAEHWAGAALTEITDARPVPVLTRDPSLDACTAFGHLADAATEEQASRFLDLASPWVEREPNHYRHTDEAHAEALTALHVPIRGCSRSQWTRCAGR